MGTNRKIKSDGEIHIDGTNVDIESTVDITGDVNATGDLGGATATVSGNATVGGTFAVTGQATLSGLAFPTSDGTVNQVLKTDGSGNISFGNAGSGEDSVVGQTEANAYTPNARVLRIQGAVNFSGKTFSHQIIIANNNITFTNCNIADCEIYVNGSVFIHSTKDSSNTSYEDGVDPIETEFVFRSRIYCNILRVRPGSASDDAPSGNNLPCNYQLENCSIHCTNFESIAAATEPDLGQEVILSKTYIKCNEFKSLDGGSGGSVTQNVRLKNKSFAQVGRTVGDIHVTDMSVLESQSTSALTKIVSLSTTVLNSHYPRPFTIRPNYTNIVDTPVLVRANLSSNQNQPNGSFLKVNFDQIDFDQTSAFDTSNAKFTAKVFGEYRVSGMIKCSSVSTSTSITVCTFKGSNLSSSVGLGTVAQQFSSLREGTFSDIIRLSVGDTIEIKTVANSSSESYSISSGSYVIIEKVN